MKYVRRIGLSSQTDIGDDVISWKQRDEMMRLY